ncbi:MAG: hypothetical protein AAGE61_16245 [Pseudomonadota bacterium]
MERFVSNFTKKVDAKGRVSVPPTFRAIFQKNGEDQIYTQLSLETPSVIAGGSSLLAQLEARIADFDPLSPEYDDWTAHLYAGSDFLKLDGEGRIVLTDQIRDYAEIGDEVTFAGRGTSFQLWKPENFETYMQGVRDRVREQRSKRTERA